MTGLRDNAKHGPSPARLGSLLRYLKEHRVTVAVVIGLSVVGAALSLAQPLIVNAIIVSVGEVQPIQSLIIWLTLLVVCAGIIGGLQQFLLARTAEAVVLSSRRRLISHLLRLPVKTYDANKTGDLVSRVVSDTNMLRGALTGGLVDVVSSSLVFSGAMVAMLLLDSVLFGITLGVVAIAILSVFMASGQLQTLTLAAQEAVGRIGAGVDRALSTVRTIRACGATDREAALLHEEAGAAYAFGVRVAKVEAVLGPVSGLALQGSFLAVLGVGGYRVAAGSLSIANLITFILFLFMMVMPLGQIFSAVFSVRSALGALARIEEIIDLPSEDAEDQTVEFQSVAPDAHPVALEFENVSFAYGNSDVISKVSLKVPLGKTTAVVGPSGAGKTTLLVLAERFYDPNGGVVRVDGVDVRNLPRADLRSRIGYVEQSAPILAGSIRENLMLGAPMADEMLCREALAAVNLLGRIDSHPDGLDATLGDDGAGLSGGERQRLAIARVLLADAPLLLLDEPTASLDSRNEQALHEALRSASQGRSVLIVAHRLATVVGADQIAVLDQGHLVAVGSHEQLLLDCALYRELAHHQLLA